MEGVKNQKMERARVGEASSQRTLTVEESLSLPVDELLSLLGSSLSGLSSEEAETRLTVYGYNELAKRKKRAAVVEFLLYFRSPLGVILLIAGLISGFLGEIPNVVIIFP